MSSERSQVSDATRKAEADEARTAHIAGETARPEEQVVERDEVDDEVRRHYREMTELGAHDQGEGRIP